MDNKVTKQRLNRHLEYDWFKYVLILLAAILGWMGIYSVLNNPRDVERIDIFAIVPEIYGEGREEFSAAIDNRLKAENDTVIVEHGIENVSPHLERLGEILMVRPLTVDIMILSNQYIESYAAYFVEMSDEMIAEYFAEFQIEYYEWTDGTKRGIKLASLKNIDSDTAGLISMREYSMTDENGDEVLYGDYVLGFVAQSTNLGKYSKAKKHDDSNAQALWAINELCRLYA